MSLPPSAFPYISLTRPLQFLPRTARNKALASKSEADALYTRERLSRDTNKSLIARQGEGGEKGS